jgi:hypothetical protein
MGRFPAERGVTSLAMFQALKQLRSKECNSIRGLNIRKLCSTYSACVFTLVTRVMASDMHFARAADLHGRNLSISSAL